MTTKNKYDSLIEKLFKVKVDFEKAKSELVQLRNSHQKLTADNEVYQNKMIELREKLHAYQKQESEKNRSLELELSEVKKYYQKSLQHIQDLKNKEK
jgi:predicted  nucleic acid-binding Zn-ribbon protein